MIGASYTGVRANGIAYKMRHDRLCNVLCVESRSVAWHVWVDPSTDDNGYRGNFPTMRKANAFLDSMRNEVSA